MFERDYRNMSAREERLIPSEMDFHSVSLSLNQVAMRALGFDVKKADVLKIMKDYDRESTGKIAFDDFNEVSK